LPPQGPIWLRSKRWKRTSRSRRLTAKAWRRTAAIPKRAVRLGPRGERVRQQAAAFQDEWRIEREIAAVARGRHPIIAGPWVSEGGFEILYWIPFLRWFEDRYRVDPKRVVAMSRRGVAAWYSDVGSRGRQMGAARFDTLDLNAAMQLDLLTRTANEVGR
jgi:hypothetical protein